MGSENFYPGEPLADDEIRVTLLGTGTPFPRRGQASASIFVEAGTEKFLLDCGPGAPQNFTSLEIPFTDVDKVFTTHHHVDHIGGLDHFLDRRLDLRAHDTSEGVGPARHRKGCRAPPRYLRMEYRN